MKKDNDYWIQIKTTNGMFSSESVASIALSNGQKVSIFVDNSLIKEDDNGNSLLKVRLVQDNPKENKKLVLLPTEPIGTHSSRWVEVASVV